MKSSQLMAEIERLAIGEELTLLWDWDGDSYTAIITCMPGGGFGFYYEVSDGMIDGKPDVWGRKNTELPGAPEVAGTLGGLGYGN
jgi:hypothetical protein